MRKRKNLTSARPECRLQCIAEQLRRLAEMRGLRKRYPTLWLLAAVAVLTSTPVLAADPSNGLRIAHRWCEACHVVTPTQTRPATDQAPPFASIAKEPGFDAGKIALFLLDPHPKMPDMGLSRSDAADLAAYIAALK
jgi:mono/diheme cytochrome c family protein